MALDTEPHAKTQTQTRVQTISDPGQDVRLDDGRVLRAHDSAALGVSGDFTVIWLHGTPQTGALLAPLLQMANERGIRVISYGRPGYGGSTPLPERTVASAANDVRQLADALGVERFAVIGASGGGPHALACAALLPERVIGVVCFASPAPYPADGIDWFAGMLEDGALRSALKGWAARERFEETATFNPEIFNARDHATLADSWAAMGEDAGRAYSEGPDGAIADDLAFVAPWGFAVEQIAAPVLIVHGGDDRVIPLSHGEWLVDHLPHAELWLRPRDGHIAILDACPLAMEWLRQYG